MPGYGAPPGAPSDPYAQQQLMAYMAYQQQLQAAQAFPQLLAGYMSGGVPGGGAPGLGGVPQMAQGAFAGDPRAQGLLQASGSMGDVNTLAGQVPGLAGRTDQYGQAQGGYLGMVAASDYFQQQQQLMAQQMAAQQGQLGDLGQAVAAGQLTPQQAEALGAGAYGLPQQSLGFLGQLAPAAAAPAEATNPFRNPAVYNTLAGFVYQAVQSGKTTLDDVKRAVVTQIFTPNASGQSGGGDYLANQAAFDHAINVLWEQIKASQGQAGSPAAPAINPGTGAPMPTGTASPPPQSFTGGPY